MERRSVVETSAAGRGEWAAMEGLLEAFSDTVIVWCWLSEPAPTNGHVYQVAGWAAMTSLLFGSVVGNFEEWRAESLGYGGDGLVSMSQGAYLAAVSVLFVAALGGLIASLRARRSGPPLGR